VQGRLSNGQDFVERLCGSSDTLAMRRAFPKRPCVLATRQTLRLDDEQVWIPASLLLWALG
jgi:hypothetical protein